MKFFATIAGVMLLASLSSTATAQATKSMTWVIKKDRWSAIDEQRYQEFVQKMGTALFEGKCRSLYNCLFNAEANPYAKQTPISLSKSMIKADCGELPSVLRTYFAWMNDLPMAYPTKHAKAKPDGGRDMRYSNYGNVITEVGWAKTGDSLNTVLAGAKSLLTGLYRIHPNWDVQGNAFTNFYSPKIDLNSIKPGSVVYDPNGHVLVVFRVDQDGTIRLIDGHPDGTVSKHQIYGVEFGRSRPAAGAGFKNWRPLSMVGMTADAQGNLHGGKPKVARNSEIPDFSLDQYYGTDPAIHGKDELWNKGKFIVNVKDRNTGAILPRELKYYDYVQFQMNPEIKPLERFQRRLESLCLAMQDRVEAVNGSIRAGIQNQRHPERLPDNIYGTSGDWETYSTPSRDARAKASARDARIMLSDFMDKMAKNDPMIVYDGNDLVGDLKNIYQEETSQCTITYTNSAGTPVTLNLEQLMDRMFKMSFDPYHCIELRWGASGQELETCKDDKNKMQWYEAEQNLRNAIERDYNIRMDKSLSELPSSNLGSATTPDIKVLEYLESL